MPSTHRAEPGQFDRIAVLLTTHERRETTLRCLRDLKHQDTSATLDVVLVDAGSTDGTADAVATDHPEVDLLRVGSDVFWNQGMRIAWQRALQRGDADAYLWLNDDTWLDDDAIRRLVDTWQQTGAGDALVTGTTRDPDTGEPTYGGVVRPSRLRAMHHELVVPGPEPRRAEASNGNCLLVPHGVTQRIGIIDPVFRQSMGDFEYGHRATAAGIPVWVAAGTIGTCRRNPLPDPDRGVLDEWRRTTSVFELPPRDWMHYTRRLAGPAWPLYFVSPYARRLVGRLTRKRP